MLLSGFIKKINDFPKGNYLNLEVLNGSFCRSRLPVHFVFFQLQQDTSGIMELAHNLTLNEEVVKTLPEEKRSVFIFEWLQFLDKVLSALNRVRVIAFATSF